MPPDWRKRLTRLLQDMASRHLLASLAVVLLAFEGYAQNWAISTNVADYANFGTLNVEGSVAAGRHWSVTAVAKYNPFMYWKGEDPVSMKQQLYGAGVRYWPWHVYSGWWAGARAQYQEYNHGGLTSPMTEEGDRYGLGLSGGYSYMLNPHLNIDFGVGVWSGYGRFVRYACPVCGVTKQRGEKLFVLPNDILLSVVYVF